MPRHRCPWKDPSQLSISASLLANGYSRQLDLIREWMDEAKMFPLMNYLLMELLIIYVSL